jgi:poly-gamma-glutamate capsule biosynthesis protein CapA/YwtB (metallophosphatase superfamily)
LPGRAARAFDEYKTESKAMHHNHSRKLTRGTVIAPGASGARGGRAGALVIGGFLFLSLPCCFLMKALTGAPEDSPSVRITVVGDVMCHAPQLSAAYDAKKKTYEFDSVFAPVKGLLSAADLTIANLETTLPGVRKQYSGYPQFGSPDSLAAALKNSGVDILTLANNHSVDKLKAGLLRTIKVVDRLGFEHLGTYASLDDHQKRRALFVERNGIRLAFLNYTYGTNGIRVPKGTVVNLIDKGEGIAADLKYVRERKPDGIVVLYHFGGEYLRAPDAYQKKWVNFALHHGADIVLGGHPHVLQPFGVREVTDRYGETRERLIAFSLGNFVSNQQRRYTDGGKIFHFTIQRNPDEDSPQRLLFRDIRYDPVWVYVERKKTGRAYHVLPVEQYLQNKGPLKLPEASYERMMRFYNDTSAHLAPSVKAVAPYRFAPPPQAETN